MKKYFTYIARCNDQSLYVGSTDNIQEREIRHNAGEGSLYTKMRRPVHIIYQEEFPTRQQAVQREVQLKGWTRIKKENLILHKHPNSKKHL